MNHGDFERIESHPGKPLEEHLLATHELAEKVAGAFGLALKPYEKKAILLHDAGKAHPAFQKKLRTGRGKFGHAEPSAVLVLNETKNLLCAEAVRRHHSHLENVAEFIKFWGEWDYEEGSQAVRELKWWPEAKRLAQAADREFDSWIELFPDQDSWDELLVDVVDSYGFDVPSLAEDWLRLRLIYSLLVTADRYEAAVGGDLKYVRPQVDKSRLERFLTALPQGTLAKWRDGVRERVVVRARQIINAPGLYILTLPTGTGKTLIGLQVAMEAAQRLNATGIIYVLPFVSLVEQNAAVAESLLGDVREDHHLAYRGEEGEDLSLKERFIEFFRYWYEPVVVTTLAKFWEVLYSPRANDAMSFHRLSRAIVVLDEPQAIPARCWDGFGKTLELISSRLETTFILMTATQPEIVHGPELAPEPVVFPKVRHELHWLERPMSVSEAAEFLVTQGIKEKDSLIVLNTRRSALEMWLELKKRGLRPYFLSRWVTPLDRSRILRELKEKERKEVRCLVATQVIEAGVDLDFDLVFRDLGPLDSIIQVAGRCNRHCRPGMGQVFVAKLVDERGRSLANDVYDGVLLDQTKFLLRQYRDFDEGSSAEIIHQYYRNVRSAVSDSPLWSNIISGKWGEYEHIFKETQPDELMLIVDYDGTVPSALVQLEVPVEKTGDKIVALQVKRQIFRKLSIQSVPVPAKLLEEWFHQSASMIIGEEQDIIQPVGSGRWVVRGAGIGRIYRPDVGFVPPAMAELMEGDF